MIEPQYIPARIDGGRGRYDVTWETERVMFSFDRERVERRGGEHTAELTVWSLDRDLEIVSGIRVNLTSAPARATLAKQLAASLARTDWPVLVEESLRMARKAMRTGEPAILLRDAPTRVAGGTLLDPLATNAGATFIIGDGGTGKSMLLLAAGIDLHTGNGSILGLEVPSPRRVLFLDWEWDAGVHRERMAAMLGDAPMPDLAYLRCDAPLVDELDRVLATVREHRSEVLLIDSAAWAAGAEPETADSAKQFFGALRRIGLPSIVTAHVPKLGDNSRPFGSVFWHNGARLTWQLAGEQNAGEQLSRVGLVNRKNNDGRLHAPIGWEVDTSDHRVRFRRVHGASIGAVADKMPIRDRALQVLVAGSMTYVQVADALDEPVRSVRGTIDRDIRERGERSRFVKLSGEDGIYRVGLRSHLEVVA